jgi:prevent-host-death family protein
MAVIMVEVPEAASRLDEMLDEVLAGQQVVVTRHGRPLGMLIPFEGSGRPGGEAGPFGGRGGAADPLEEHEPPSRPYHDIVLVRRRLTVIAYMP